MDNKYYENEIVPFDDEDMVYNDKKHRYILTAKFADKISLGVIGKSYLEGKQTEARRNYALQEHSADMYKFVYKWNRRDERKRRTTEHLLAKNGDFRDFIKDSMADMVRADIRGGYQLQKDLSWVNPERGTVMDLSDIPSIAPDARDGLLESGILYKGEYSYRIDDEDYRSDY